MASTTEKAIRIILFSGPEHYAGAPRDVSLTPHLPRRLGDQFELALLVVGAEQIADDVGGEAALRADRKLIERNELRRLVDPALEPVHRFHLRHLGADQAEHHDLAFRHEAQRLKTAGARSVVFQQKAVVRQFVEQPLGNGVVAAFAVPHAALVAAAKMDAAGHLAQVLQPPSLPP